VTSDTSDEGADLARRQRIIDELRVAPGAAANLAARDTRWTGGGAYDQLSGTDLDAAAKAVLADGIERLKDAQELLWASDTYALLVVFQAMDAAGKDSTIKHVMSGVNPSRCPGRFVQATVEPGTRSHLISGESPTPSPNEAGSGSSTDRNTRRSSPSA
jgi:hypothetical protein